MELPVLFHGLAKATGTIWRRTGKPAFRFCEPFIPKLQTTLRPVSSWAYDPGSTNSHLRLGKKCRNTPSDQERIDILPCSGH